MSAISEGSPNTFQASIQQNEAQNQAEVDQRREAQAALRAERQSSQESQAPAPQTEQATLETQAQSQPDPNQRVGTNVDVTV